MDQSRAITNGFRVILDWSKVILDPPRVIPYSSRPIPEINLVILDRCGVTLNSSRAIFDRPELF